MLSALARGGGPEAACERAAQLREEPSPSPTGATWSAP